MVQQVRGAVDLLAQSLLLLPSFLLLDLEDGDLYVELACFRRICYRLILL
jgi:hypothetical protein